MNKKFQSVAVRLMAVLLFAALVTPTAWVANANDSREASTPTSTDYTAEYPLYWCVFGNPYQWSAYQVFLQTDKLRNTSGQQATLDVYRSITRTHSINATAGFEFYHVSAALSFTIEQSVTHSVGVSLPVPAHHVGKVKTYARYVPYLSDYTCYWRGSNAVMSTGTVRVDRYMGIDYQTVVKPIKA